MILPIAALASIAASPLPSADLDIVISGLRNLSGAVMLCLTQRIEAQYLECAKDPARITRIVPSNVSGAIRIAGLTPSDYSLLVIHNENRNSKLDTMLGVPREGFGFRVTQRCAWDRRATATSTSRSSSTASRR